jgi:hypothetical protein
LFNRCLNRTLVSTPSSRENWIDVDYLSLNRFEPVQEASEMYLTGLGLNNDQTKIAIKKALV